MSTNIFEQASQCKLRFESNRGRISVEQLWDLPLTTTDANTVSLDDLAKAANRVLKQTNEESFVETAPNAVNALAQLQLDILKHVIAYKIAENKRKADAAVRRAERARILAQLAQRDQKDLEAMDRDALLKKLDDLDAE